MRSIALKKNDAVMLTLLFCNIRCCPSGFNFLATFQNDMLTEGNLNRLRGPLRFHFSRALCGLCAACF